MGQAAHHPLHRRVALSGRGQRLQFLHAGEGQVGSGDLSVQFQTRLQVFGLEGEAGQFVEAAAKRLHFVRLGGDSRGHAVAAVAGQQVVHDMLPNKSPEPTAVGAVSSAIAVHVASRRWLSFFR